MTGGTVYLVGAGPGDPELITAKGLRLLQAADVVVYDRLVDSRLLGRARAGAELVDAGKGRGQRRMSQEEINDLLVHLAQEGKGVVRLKGGDPFLFGRGGEEAAALAGAHVPFEVVPGVTSALAAPAYAGIPVTHRSLSSSLAIVTGAEDPTKPDSRVDWANFAGVDTLVVLMGVQSLAAIAAALVNAGRPLNTPAALVHWGTEPYQVTVTGSLANIAQRAREAQLRAPVAVVIGQVVRLRDQLRWFDNRPLFGKRVLITRTREQAGTLARLLTEEGARPIELPTIAITPVDDLSTLDAALRDVQAYRWLLFTSANAVDLVFERLKGQGCDARALGGVQVGAIGPGTAAALQAHGVRADYVPTEFVSEALATGIRERLGPGDRVLLPRAAGGRDVLPRELRASGATVVEAPIYRAAPPPLAGERARNALREGVDVVTFTSSSTVRNLVELLDGDVTLLRDLTIACIGPVTASAAAELGLHVDVTAREYSVPGLVRALREHAASMTSDVPT